MTTSFTAIKGATPEEDRRILRTLSMDWGQGVFTVTQQTHTLKPRPGHSSGWVSESSEVQAASFSCTEEELKEAAHQLLGLLL